MTMSIDYLKGEGMDGVHEGREGRSQDEGT